MWKRWGCRGWGCRGWGSRGSPSREGDGQGGIFSGPAQRGHGARVTPSGGSEPPGSPRDRGGVPSHGSAASAPRGLPLNLWPPVPPGAAPSPPPPGLCDPSARGRGRHRVTDPPAGLLGDRIALRFPQIGPNRRVDSAEGRIWGQRNQNKTQRCEKIIPRFLFVWDKNPCNGS